MGVGPACRISLPLASPSGSGATFPVCGTLPYTPSWPAVPGSTLLHSAFMWVGDMLVKKWSPKKHVVLWTVGKASSSMNKVTVTLEHGRMTQEWGTFSLGRETLSLWGASHMRVPIPGPGPALKLAGCVFN